MHSQSKIYRFFAFLMAALMFTTSTSFTVDMHYCKGELKSVNIFGKAKSCHQQKTVKTCPHHANMQQQQEDNDCCDNETTYVQADIQKTFQSVEFADLQQFADLFIPFFYYSNHIKKQEIAHYHYKPPLIQKDIPILIQSFLL